MVETLTLYADYVCPFCYLGRVSLSRYRESRQEPLAVDWHPFDLRAGKRGPDGAIDRDVDDGKDDEYFAEARANVRRLAERYGVEMAREIAVEVDALPAQIVSLAVDEKHPNAWEAFDGAVFAALWEDGLDVGDRDVLVDLADGIDGLPADVVDAALTDAELRERLDERFAAARREGVTGVPTFAYGGRVARGAVPPEQLRRLVEGTNASG